MRIRKWYLDCVAEDGTTFIGYCLRIRWAGLQLTCSASLLGEADAPVLENFAWRRQPFPMLSASGISWDCAPLGVHGVWHAHAPRIRRRLFQNEDGAVDWLCHQPAARCTVNVSGRVVQGRGYVEELRLSLPPWQLPIDELSWGRFISDDASLVWISWTGAQPLQLAFQDGRETDATLRPAFIESRTLRSSPLEPTLQRIPVVGSVVARKLGRTFEHKMLSRAVLAGGQEGWALHETVKWRALQKR